VQVAELATGALFRRPALQLVTAEQPEDREVSALEVNRQPCYADENSRISR
jgi:hypothetical protein